MRCTAVEPVKRSSATYSVRTFRVVVALTSAKPQGHRSALSLPGLERLLERPSPFG
jgi:hypothetical protein